MSFRDALYWSHLICGVVAGLVVLTMSVTGVLLTYERQIVANAVSSDYNAVPSENAKRLPIEEIVNIALEGSNISIPRSVVFKSDPAAPVLVSIARGNDLYLNPYTGKVLGKGPLELKAFFRSVTTFHRWFSLTGADRATGRMITGAANLMFLFILISGIYLWLPKIYKWASFKKVLFFRKTTSSHARDFNWHHVMGIWSVIPMVVIVATATVFNYGWANNLVYTMMGEEPPVRGSTQPKETNPVVPNVGKQSLDTLLETAALKENQWQTISMTFPKSDDFAVRFSVDNGNGGEPTKRGTLILDRYTGLEKSWAPFASNSPGRQARIYIRFLHTGEALGPIGQTIAGIGSFLMILMVWTGLALAYRKYLQPIFNKKLTRSVE